MKTSGSVCLPTCVSSVTWDQTQDLTHVRQVLSVPELHPSDCCDTSSFDMGILRIVLTGCIQLKREGSLSSQVL